MQPRARRRAAVRGRARDGAVALVLVVGGVAVLATSPRVPDPCPSTTEEVSEFFGPQDEDDGLRTNQVRDSFETGPFRTSSAPEVSAPSCVAEHAQDGLVTVGITVGLADDGTGPTPEEFLRAALLVDGDGRARTPTDVTVAADRTATSDGRPVQNGHVEFAVPLDVPEPVVLQVPDLDGGGGRGGTGDGSGRFAIRVGLGDLPDPWLTPPPVPAPPWPPQPGPVA